MKQWQLLDSAIAIAAKKNEQKKAYAGNASKHPFTHTIDTSSYFGTGIRQT